MNACYIHVLAVHCLQPSRNFGRLKPSSCVLGIWLWLTIRLTVLPMWILIPRHSKFLGFLKRFWRWNGGCHCDKLYLRNVNKLYNFPTTHMEGFMTFLLQSIYLTGHDAFWSCEQRSWRLSSIRTSCLHASICFWEVWREMSKHMCRDRPRELQILADFALTCASNSCRVPFHKSEANNVHITFQPNNPGWLLLTSFSWLPTGCLIHKASGSLQSATHNPIARSQDAQTSWWWTSNSESSCWWGWASQHSWHAGILLGLKLCTGNEVPWMDACFSRLRHV